MPLLSGNHSFPDIFRGYRKRPVARNESVIVSANQLENTAQKMKFLLRISALNLTKSAGNFWSHILKKFSILKKTSMLVP